jgi:hypothetical protein
VNAHGIDNCSDNEAIPSFRLLPGWETSLV